MNHQKAKHLQNIFAEIVGVNANHRVEVFKMLRMYKYQYIISECRRNNEKTRSSHCVSGHGSPEKTDTVWVKIQT